VVFTVAGRNPLPALIGRAGPSVQILGDVPDISTEIAASALYVAPLVSGGGFKNKVIEAISCGTFVVSTTRGVEFLDNALRELLLVADAPGAFAGDVLRFLQDPEPFAARLRTLQARIASDYTWGHRAEQLIGWLPDSRLARRA
jgi:glycosyltransferase involved in cell wall biosynthesis